MSEEKEGWMLVMVSSCHKWYYLRYDPERPANDAFTQHYTGWEPDAYKKATRWPDLKDAMTRLNHWIQAGGFPNSGGYLVIQYSTKIKEMEKQMKEHRNA